MKTLMALNWAGLAVLCVATSGAPGEHQLLPLIFIFMLTFLLIIFKPVEP